MTILFLVQFWLACGQVKIVKTVVSRSDKQPVTLAHVTSCKNPKYGTITNEDGLFVFYVKDRSDSLEITHISFTSVRIPVSFQPDTVFLESKAVMLEDVVIGDLTAEEVMRNVVRNLHKNHAVEPVLYKAFMRLIHYPKDSSEVHLFEEHLMNIYQTKQHNSKFQIIKARIGAFSERGEKELKDYLLTFVISIFSDNLLKFQPDFLMDKKMKNFIYEFNQGLCDEEDHYVVLCSSRTETSNIIAELCINKNTFGISRIKEYYANGFGFQTYRERKFQNVNNKWYLLYSFRKFILSKTKHQPKQPVIIDRVCIYNLEDMQDMDLQGFKGTLNMFAEPVSVYAGRFDDAFWENVNYLPIPYWVSSRMKRAENAVKAGK